MIQKMIEAAAQATDDIHDRVSAALDTLNRDFNGRIVNGYGIYSDSSRQYHALIEARKEIEAALALHNATRWPRNVDYDCIDEGTAE